MSDAPAPVPGPTPEAAVPAVPAPEAAVPAVPTDPSVYAVGLEDVEASDLVMPTIKIDHERGKLVDSNSGEEYDELYWIMLGLVKQRVLWPPEVSEGKEYPLCRSYDFHTGHPDEDKFPWKASNFNPQSYSDPVRLPCDECPLQVWGSHPNREAPWCSEQHTYPVLVPFGDDGKNLAPAIFMAQRSGIKPSKNYLTSFANKKEPMFSVMTKITLDLRRRGTNDFAVPIFTRMDPTDKDLWPYFGEQYYSIRDFLQTPRSRDDDGDSVDAAEAPDAPPADPAAPPTPEAAAAAAGADPDLPF
jgi:hypothetical protein